MLSVVYKLIPLFRVTCFIAGHQILWHIYRCYIVNGWIKMLDGGIQIESLLPQYLAWLLLGFGGNLKPLFFVNIPSIILRPDKYNK